VVLYAPTGTGFTYQWFVDGDIITGATSGTYISSFSGAYTVAVTDADACRDTSAEEIVVLNLSPMANAGADASVSVNTSAQLTGTASGGTQPYNFSWQPASVIASGASENIATSLPMTSSTVFTLYVSDANGCQGSDEMIVSVHGGMLGVAINAAQLLFAAGILLFFTRW